MLSVSCGIVTIATALVCSASVSTAVVTKLNATVGENITLPCYSTVLAHVEWKHDKETVALDGEILNGKKGRLVLVRNATREHHLFIPNATVDDAGNYSCIEDHGAGTRHEVTLRVSDSSISGQYSERIELSATAGEQAILPCHASASADKVVWKRGQEDTIASGGHVSIGYKARFSLQISANGDHNLVINSASVDDGDLYHCFDDNGKGKPHDVSLTVSEPLNYVSPLGGTVVLECHPSLQSEVQWSLLKGWPTRPSKSIVASNGVLEKDHVGRYLLGQSLKGLNYLIISSCRSSDAGMYVCQENNGTGKEHRVLLRVLDSVQVSSSSSPSTSTTSSTHLDTFAMDTMVSRQPISYVTVIFIILLAVSIAANILLGLRVIGVRWYKSPLTRKSDNIEEAVEPTESSPHSPLLDGVNNILHSSSNLARSQRTVSEHNYLLAGVNEVVHSSANLAKPQHTVSVHNYLHAEVNEPIDSSSHLVESHSITESQPLLADNNGMVDSSSYWAKSRPVEYLLKRAGGRLPSTSATNGILDFPREVFLKISFGLFSKHKADTATADIDALLTLYSVCRTLRSTLSSTPKNDKRKYRASVSYPYKHKPRFSKNITKPNQDVLSFTKLRDKTYVARKKAIDEYDAEFKLIRTIDIMDNVSLTNFTAHCEMNCLYIADSRHRCVWKTNLGKGDNETHDNGYQTNIWYTPKQGDENVRSVSVKNEKEVVVLVGDDYWGGYYWHGQLVICDNEGNTKKTIPLLPELMNPTAVTCTGESGTFLVTFQGDKGGGLHEINTKGRSVKNCNTTLTHPRKCHFDRKSGCIFVIDVGNDRLLLLDRELRLLKIVMQWSTNHEGDVDNHPVRAYYDKEAKQLMVGMFSGRISEYSL